MGKFKSCSVLLDGNKEVYRRGEKVEGTLQLEVAEPLTVKGVRVYLYGETLVKWNEFVDRTYKDFVSKEKYFGQVNTVFGKRANEAGPNVNLSAGCQRYRFLFRLPEDANFPSSFEGKHGATRYWVKVEVDKPFPGINNTWHRCITFLGDIDVNDTMYKSPKQGRKEKTISKFLGIGDVGTISLSASTDRGAYCPGEKIGLNVTVENNSSKDMGRVIAEFMQTVEFYANNEKRETTIVFRTLQGSPLERGGKVAWRNKLLQVDAIPPSTKPTTCHVIIVKYYVKVFVEVPWGFNLNIYLPITIGTVPFSQKDDSTEGATASSFEIDLSSAITYTKCNKGVLTCSKSEGNFVNISYVPMCPYAVNYVFQPPCALPANQHAAEEARPNQSEQKTVSGKAAIVAKPSTCEPTAPPTDEPPSYEEVQRMDNL